MTEQWYTRKWFIISLHLLFWALFFVSPFLFRPSMDIIKLVPKGNDYTGFYYLHVLNGVMRLILFYVNAHILIPKLVYRKKYVGYGISIVLAFIVLMIWDKFFFQVFLGGDGHRIWNFFVFNLLPISFIVIASSAYILVRDRVAENQLKKEKETENLKTELSFLRSQVSPHFMFNVLNNMVALARKKSDELEPSLIKLSSLLRYMLYETDEDRVLLEKEVTYLQSYIDLQKQRFGKNVRINAAFPEIGHSYSIEPMLLIPFVENAFKHGTGMITNAQIDIDMSVVAGMLSFTVRNKSGFKVDEPKDKTSGIGLNNVRRRLKLLYAGNHQLEVNQQDGWFTVHLQLKLH
ncbi:MAG: histidine kinase [Chitinophagaceae bacterium]|nr:MAG: histidine kinase [Chitinophagaceae bacterium]